ncbi:GAF and ANTAR domain-containing protein [Streptomyces sp. NPDC052225]|uniref:GAF and ANTAR domain-containing protein n=1 Tax=Streptomyces sp. NPDC052225 TaxID=3154949 RepID=UPI00341E7F12
MRGAGALLSDLTAERQLADAAVQLVDKLLDEEAAEDAVLEEWAHWCSAHFGVREAGVLLADDGGALRVVAATAPDVRMLQTVAADSGEGPGPGAFHSGMPVVVDDLAAAADRWPAYASWADEFGIVAIGSLPLRHRASSRVLGVLNLFVAESVPSKESMRAAQSLADAAGTGLAHRRAMGAARRTVGQLEHALASRVLIEQAKGILAERWRTDVGTAFDRLRRHARSRRVRLDDISRAVVARDPDGDPFAV